MAFDLKELISKFEEWFNSDEVDICFKKRNELNEIRKNRQNHFDEWLKYNDFDKLIYRLILEHNDDYREKCYHNGKEPYPNNKLDFLIEYVFAKTESIEIAQLETEFTNQVNLFNGYYFQIVCGQGTIVNIYNKEDLRLVLQI